MELNTSTIAVQYYHGKEGFNCCQAVLKAYANSSNMTDEYIEENFRKFGGGRAPEGRCGAVYAAEVLLKNNPEAIQDILDKFKQQAEHSDCRSIRKANKLSCRECVELVGELLADKINTKE
ncbi:MAG: C-GCAxxG-C-C family protein [Sedimentisphaerales bacterium]|nr:C-GCAxxG-C-C family protein [Sedimentisphaerales bacterium]MBN2841659.1 C-GCAxxG-C-C family protein [Sedimentisphaerales bacterium]